jgi:hypothetical protein
MSDFLFVISKYKEDTSWVNNLNCDYIIFNKYEGYNGSESKLENIGREAHTYLTYIINNYNNLPNKICFLQGNPFNIISLVDLINIKNINSDFLQLGRIEQCYKNGYPFESLDIENIFLRKHFIDYPEYIKYSVGAQFIVSSDLIKIRKIEFYKNILEEFTRNDIPLVINNRNTDPNAWDYIEKTEDNNRMPWLLERVWGIIFNKNYKSYNDNF